MINEQCLQTGRRRLVRIIPTQTPGHFQAAEIQSLREEIKAQGAAQTTEIQSLRDENKALQDKLASLVNYLDAFAKERLEMASRDNLHIEGLKRIYCLAYGNYKHVTQALADDAAADVLASFQRRMLYLKGSIEKLLNDEGVRPIAPSRNDELSDSEHCIVQTVECDGPECLPRHIAECLEVGFAIHGRITPAKVTVFASVSEDDGNKTNNKTTKKEQNNDN